MCQPSRRPSPAKPLLSGRAQRIAAGCLQRSATDAPLEDAMKFTWFNLMPWPHLPDDFREKNRSVWVDIDQALFDPVKCHEVYNDYLDLLEYADQLG
jgi:hypothetical protein